jgi:capsular polysaccharide biosynthesis protein
LATLLAISAAYLGDYFDTSFHTPAQVMDTLGIPVVVAVSKKTA